MASSRNPSKLTIVEIVGSQERCANSTPFFIEVVPMFPTIDARKWFPIGMFSSIMHHTVGNISAREAASFGNDEALKCSHL